MKVLILSDIHDNIVRLRHVLGFASVLGAKAIIVCGDWGRALTTINEFHTVKQNAADNSMKIYGVLGNADIKPEVKSKIQMSNIKLEDNFLEINFGGRKIGLSHFPTSSITLGGKALKKAAESQKYDILLFGHTHKKSETMFGHTKLINPGAIGRTLSPSFAVYDTEKNSVEFVDILY